VQVRAGAPAGAAGRADALARLDLLADADAPAGQVAVKGDVPAPERDLDHVAVALQAPGRPHRDHASRLRRAHSERAEDADVDPRVPAARVVSERSGDGSLGRPSRPGRHRLRLLERGARERKGD
jgi:hypothetical protein